MPRDLFSSTPAHEPRLTESPETQTPGSGSALDQETNNQFVLHTYPSENKEVHLSRSMRAADNKHNLHPYVQTLSLSDLESCVALETAAFPENERCSREKFIYRLTKCPELSLGLFSTISTPPVGSSAASYFAAHAPNSYAPNNYAVLLAQVIATKTTALAVTDASMGFPSSFLSHPDYDQRASNKSSYPGVHDTSMIEPPLGHDEFGSTLSVHSVCVLPEYQGRGLGKTILKSYMQRMEGSGVADRLALLAHHELVRWYEALGFVDKGESAVKFGGGNWREMLYEFKNSGNGF